MKEGYVYMKIFIFTAILMIINGCQSRHIPILSNMHERSEYAIPIEKKPIDTTQETKELKKLQKNTISKSEKKKINIPLISPSKILKQKKEQKEKVTPSRKTIATHRKNTVKHKKLHIELTDAPSLANRQNIPKNKIIKQPIEQKYVAKKPTKPVDTIIDTQVIQSKKSFSGGGIIDGLDMATIRIGKSSDYTSIIFDSYVYEGNRGLPSQKASNSGNYLFTYEPEKKRIVGLIDGYKAFSALLNNQRELFSDNTIVENIYVVKHLVNDGIKFIIKLRKNVRVNIFNVKNPGRIIVNLFPL